MEKAVTINMKFLMIVFRNVVKTSDLKETKSWKLQITILDWS